MAPREITCYSCAGTFIAAKKKTLGILFGGASSEHEVSLASAANVIHAAREMGYEVVEAGITKEGRWVVGNGALAYLISNSEKKLLPTSLVENLASILTNYGLSITKELPWESQAEEIKNRLSANLDLSKGNLPAPSTSSFASIDVIFPLIHGTTGEDGAIQGLCKVLKLPVVGCGILGSAVCMDKVLMNRVIDSEGVPQAKWIALDINDAIQKLESISKQIEDSLNGYPVFVKPSNSGSSIGITKVHSPDELEKSLMKASEVDLRIVIEEAVSGRELELGVLGWRDLVVSPVASEIIPTREFYDYEAKYVASDTTRIDLPADIPDEILKKMQEYAKQIFRAVDGRGMARVDFFYKEESSELFLNEVNTIPGFTEISQYPALMKTAGFSYGELIEKLVEIAVEYHERTAHLK